MSSTAASLFTLGGGGSQNRKYYIIWNACLLHSFGLSCERYMSTS